MTHALLRVRRGLGGVWRWILSIPTKARLIRKDREERLAAAKPVGPTVEERQEELVQFYSHYEELVETLCDAAQVGLNQKLEERYERERRWMDRHYGGLRPYVVAYLRFDPADAEQSQAFSEEAVDAFESLFAAPTLGEFIRADDGSMISRIMRTRDALTSYAEHLRQLESKQA